MSSSQITCDQAIAPLLETDAYKIDHRRQYGLAGNVTRVYSNYTNRKSRIPDIDRVVHFGLQAYLNRLGDAFDAFFDYPSGAAVGCAYHDRVRRILGAAGKEVGGEHITELHTLGYLPLEFCALPEGLRVPVGVPVFTVENTHPDFAWLTNYVETGVSASYWAASTAATIAREYRAIFEDAAARSGAPRSLVDQQAHDFSFRGMSSPETAAAVSAAHLLSFSGSDTISAGPWIERNYGGNESYRALRSIPATEHSVMSAGITSLAGGELDRRGGSVEGEIEMFRRLLDLYPDSPVAVVSDTFDLWRVLTTVVPALRDKILARPEHAPLIIRPDSGDPVKILLGDDSAPAQTPAFDGVISLLEQVFGGGRNDCGYRRLPPQIGAIYGDSITPERARQITGELISRGVESTAITLGVGSFTYQYVTRDTLGSAMKATWAEVDGRGINLFKNPITDDGTKRSATGRLAVRRDEHGVLRLIERATPEQEERSLLEPVWRDGDFLRWQTFAEVRDLVRGAL